MKYIGDLYVKLGGKYLKISHTDIFEDLKRLQKEIDEAEEKRTTIICRTWGFGEQGNDDEEHQILMDIIESNQLKIKQIIESL